jgi:uncharacterized membrane protein
VSNPKNSEVNRDELPFVAPCRDLSPLAPFRWLGRGVKDLMHAPQQSLTYGVVVALLIGVVCLLAWFRGSQWFMFSMIGGFVFLAPLTCIGLYAISAQLERGQEPLLARSLRAALKRHFGNEMVFALALLVIFLVWARAAVTFSASAFSLPMIMHRDVDSVTAIVTSINAVLRNKWAMAVWLTIIVVALLIGIATAFVGLIVIIPVIGYAAWHGYLETIDASAFPRHAVGITALPRRETESEDQSPVNSSAQ